VLQPCPGDETPPAEGEAPPAVEGTPPCTLHPAPCTLHPELSRNPDTRNLEPGNLNIATQTPKPEIWNLKFRNPNLGTRNPEPGKLNSEVGPNPPHPLRASD
jgi:hypothetical protein